MFVGHNIQFTKKNYHFDLVHRFDRKADIIRESTFLDSKRERERWNTQTCDRLIFVCTEVCAYVDVMEGICLLTIDTFYIYIFVGFCCDNHAVKHLHWPQSLPYLKGKSEELCQCWVILSIVWTIVILNCTTIHRPCVCLCCANGLG